MEYTLGSRLKNAWNAFKGNTQLYDYSNLGYSSSYRPDRPRLSYGHERSIVNSVYNRIAVDVASINIRHVRLDSEDRYLETIHSGLNNCLTVEANVDQTGRAFIQDVAMSLMDEGSIAIVPVDTDISPTISGSYDIDTMRVGQIVDWYPRHVRVKVYNDNTGKKEEIILPKSTVAIVENPLYSVMNEPNSTMQRLIRKLNLLDSVDEQSSAGKLDLIIQLPYIIKTEAKRKEAEKRLKEIEDQLSGTKYGIAYADGTEKIVQLNRPINNNLMSQIEYLTSMLYSQLGITTSVLDGTADEKTMLNYHNRTIEPIISSIVDSMIRTFLTKTARTQKQSIMFFRDPFRLVPINNIAEIADTFARNEIMTSNEVRQGIGMRPSSDPNADKLRNSNMPQPAEGFPSELVPESEPMSEEEYNEAMNSLDEADKEIDDFQNEMDKQLKDENDELQHYASPYYDPIKAHEYYERTKKLKGRTTTAGLNEKGIIAAKFVKDNLRNEKKQKSEKLRTDYKINKTSNRENRKAILNTHLANIKGMIEAKRTVYKGKLGALNNKLKNMSPEQKKQQRESIKEEKARLKGEINADIKSIRDKNKAERERVTAEYKAQSEFSLQNIRPRATL